LGAFQGVNSGFGGGLVAKIRLLKNMLLEGPGGACEVFENRQVTKIHLPIFTCFGVPKND